MTAVAAHEHRKMTIEEYLEMEGRSLDKHYYVKDHIVPMPGGTLKHNRIATNVAFAIEEVIRRNDLPFIVSNSDTKIWIPNAITFYYPDAVVICEMPEYYKNRKDVILNPLLIIEVVSSSTKLHDLSTKFLDYATLPSFKEYMTVDQDQPLVRVSQRVDSADWQINTCTGIDTAIELKSIGYSIAMADIYLKTENL